ncbi:nuclear transport factor 2 family protein [Microbacterium sp. dk485]|uniref:nuclear transport factor 2 family protein n=1 Tax=Microbacterium sp. dk485 TaxID=2560021 RepID=UPI001072FFDE|nr:nuclear transport factor 2 family protein [Microbacterium sp. dk485]TFV80919.1 nuclear transport factor 2 family protein [Microbacterium sp. dk485]
MTDPTALPDAIRTFVDATNAADTERFVAAFAADARLNDWGREFRGHEGIRSWNSTDNIGVQAHFEVVDVAAGEHPDTYVVTLAVTGNGYNGTGPMRFHVHDGLIADVDIS